MSHTVIVDKDECIWKAYILGRPGTTSVGNTKWEALGALLVNNPHHFDAVIINHDSTHEETTPLWCRVKCPKF